MTNAEMHLRAGRGIGLLGQRLKFLGQEHRERIKRLRGLQEDLQSEETKHPHGGELVETTVTVSPDVLALVEDPLAGL